MKVEDLPSPECPGGYPNSQITEIFQSQVEEARFWKWMDGQTMMLCDGKKYDHDKGEYEPSECADHPHGPVVYPWDMREYIQFDGRRMSDW